MATGACIQKSGAKYSRYLALGQYIDGHWKGSAAERLGIAGNVSDAKSFDALTSLRNPLAGEQLKPKHKQKITMWDLTMAAPKSISILALYDPGILEAHRNAAALIPEIEQELVPSKNMIWTQVEHHESRAGDPHIHTHTPIINLTFNPESGRWECLRPNFMNYWAQYQLKESYRHAMVPALIEKGYGIIDKPKQGFEIEGVSQELMHRLSQRSQQIEHYYEVNMRRGMSYREMGQIGRPSKQLPPPSYAELLEVQREKLTLAERQSLKQVVEKAGELRYKLGVPSVGEGSGGGPSQARWSYGYLV